MSDLAIKAHAVLYVADQARATKFYAFVFGIEPTLDVPGMTEFSLNSGSVLGIMPKSGAAKLLNMDFSDTSEPRTEVYIVVDSAEGFHTRALEAGARELSPMSDRDWGHRAGYSIDPDGHVLAFAEII